MQGALSRPEVPLYTQPGEQRWDLQPPVASGKSEHSVPFRWRAQVSTHRVIAHPKLAPHKGPEDSQQPVPGEPPPTGLTVRGELLQRTQPACAAACSTLGHGPHPPTHLTFSTRPLTFSNCSAAWSQSRVDVRHLSASCRKVVTAAAMSCEGGARMIPYPGSLLWLRCLMPNISPAAWTRRCPLGSSLKISSPPGAHSGEHSCAVCQAPTD